MKYQILAMDGKTVVMDGSFMPMNADDGPHYGANIKKGLKVGQYKLRFIIEPPTDYLLHTDPETGVPAKDDAKNFFQTHTVEFNWNYTANVHHGRSKNISGRLCRKGGLPVLHGREQPFLSILLR